MTWHLVRVNESRHDLVVSDRPLISTNGLSSNDCYLIMPLDPKLMFVAVRDDAKLQYFKSLDASLLVEAVNDTIAPQAKEYVFARNQKALRYVDKRLKHGFTPSFVRMVQARKAV